MLFIELHRIALNFLVLGRGDTEFRPIVDADSTALRALPPESKLTIEAIFHNPYQPRRIPASDTRLASSAAVDDMEQRQVRQRLESREFVPSTRGIVLWCHTFRLTDILIRHRVPFSDYG